MKEDVKVVYVDLDGTLVNNEAEIVQAKAEGRLADFANVDPFPGVRENMERLAAAGYEVYILSTSPYGNPPAAGHKMQWCQDHLGDVVRKRVILTHQKQLHVAPGAILIDDRLANGSEGFDETGTLILIGRDVETFAEAVETLV